MESTRASFQNIGKTIEELILKSKTSIYISVAWFTNKELLGLLTEKARNGVNIQIIISDDIVNKRQNPKDFISVGGNFNILQTNSGKFLHEKFAFFDNETILTGSYNWTYFAEYKNHESVIISNNELLVKQFSIRFKKLLEIVVNFNNELLVNRVNIGADIAEEEFEKLEQDLEQDLIRALEESKKLNTKIKFELVYPLIKSYGAIGASKRLMLTGTDKIQSGFIKMWELNRMDLTFESIITKKKYQLLFDIKTLNNAHERLQKFEKSSH
ncbi:hypothetical protein FFWV33_14395 [Flavobacterium faecale]|uniref:phospholipase D n=1 Tax=Flavobacterium faecale TaxID=1355330 RepID=A0A2S1LG48_9FLAO|nr:phospholipase D-like domain-containing protein [Flavobacterium faecale]AWG22631.1 hypothetical protein FFWV33_14395 [Flavobacterium faecale]